ncbi:MAG: hypothetical protein CMH12_23945 [Maritimibacter sp.]|nr:hypothetical protein [Maritimibacter sp.]
MTGDWPVALFVLLAGPAVGSFLGVVVDRVADGRSLWSRSACEACGARLGPLDLVPILSSLRGRCRHCGAEIPGHLLRLEIAALAVSAIAVALATGPATMLELAAFLWCLVGLFYADLLHFRLPNVLTAALFVAGLALAAVTPGRSVPEALATAAAGVLVFWLLRIGYRRLRGREGLGLGDVKMMAGLGAGLGPEALPLAVLAAAVLALLVAVVEGWRRGAGLNPQARVPFGAWLSGGAVLALLL